MEQQILPADEAVKVDGYESLAAAGRAHGVSREAARKWQRHPEWPGFQDKVLVDAFVRDHVVPRRRGGGGAGRPRTASAEHNEARLQRVITQLSAVCQAIIDEVKAAAVDRAELRTLREQLRQLSQGQPKTTVE